MYIHKIILNQIQATREKAENMGLLDLVDVFMHDIRNLLPFEYETFDAFYSHMPFTWH
ncbi:MAG: class I SAM-dependent methyltransferase [Methanosarcina sp.]